MGLLKKLFVLSALLASLAVRADSNSAADASAVEQRPFVGFERGMGLGGWLTNYKRFNVLPDKWKLAISPGDREHFDTYITEADIKNIADMGFDHIRLGFDQIVLEEKPGVYRDDMFRHIDDFISWCKKYRLNVVLNLHKAIGNYCDIKEEVSLMDDPELQKRFVALWLEIERRYHNDKGVAFELMNEVRDVKPELWNELADKAVKALRAQNQTRKIIIGSTRWNSPDTLKYLKIYDDPNIIYTFHVYSPFELTHQRGVLQSGPLYYNRALKYPSDIAPYNEFYSFVYGKNKPQYGNAESMDIREMEKIMKPAFDFVKNHPDKILWCGEFGTIRHCDLPSRENWTGDVILLLKKHKIPYCVWNYLSTPNDGNRFSLVDDDSRKILSPKLLDACLGKIDSPAK